MTASPGREEYYQSLIDPDRLLVVPDQAKPALRRRIVNLARKLGLALERGHDVAREVAHGARDRHSIRIQQDLRITIDDCELEPDGSLVWKQALKLGPGATPPKHRRRAPLTQSNLRIWLSGQRALDKASDLKKALAKAHIVASICQVHRLPDQPESKQRYAAEPWRVMVTFKTGCDTEDSRGKLSELLDIERGDEPWHEARVLKPLDPYELYAKFSKLARDRAELSFHGLPLLLPLASVPTDDDYTTQQRTKLALINAEPMWGVVEPLADAGTLSPVVVFLIDTGVDVCDDAPVDADESVKVDESTPGTWEMGSEPLDGNPHGTQMASVIGAAWDGEHMAGITGVAGETIKLISLRCASLYDMRRALTYAAGHIPAGAKAVAVFGLDVLLFYSCAVARPDIFGTEAANFKAELTRVTTAIANPLLVIMPSGNKDQTNPADPFLIPMPPAPNNLVLTGTVIVGSCNSLLQRSVTPLWSSRYGADLWMLAPGEEIYTLLCGTPPDYDPDSGTSFAAAHAAGVAALMRSINPGLTVVQLKDKLKMCCGAPPTFTPERGWGALNGHKAVT